MRIVYEESGFPRELTEQAEWARAIASGSLRTATIVTVTRNGDPAMVLPAGDVPELLALFKPAVANDRSTPSAAAVAPGTGNGGDRDGEASTTSAVTVASASAPAPARATEPGRPAQAFSLGEVSPPPPGPLPESAQVPVAEPTTSSPYRDVAKWMLVGVAGLLLVLLILTNLSSSEDRGDAVANMAATANSALINEAEPEAGEAIAEGTAVAWTDTGSPKTYLAEGLTLSLTAEKDRDGPPVPVMTVRSAELGDSKIVGTPGGETAAATFMVLRPRRGDRIPSVLLMTFSMGAHCCTSIRLLTPRGGGWTLADLGEWDGEPLSTAPTDLDGDGLLDFVLRDNAFLYAFASYAESWAPSLVYNIVDGKFVDRSASPRFRSLHLADMARTRAECANHSNGACAAFVATAARVGQAAAALEVASANFNPAATEGWLPTRCATRAVDGGCPPGSEQQPGGFVEALDWFLQDHGYVAGPIATVPPFELDVGDAEASEPAGDNATPTDE